MSGVTSSQTLTPHSEQPVATDLLAGLLMEQASARAADAVDADRVTAKIYALMVVTTVLTFGALLTCYQLFFAQQLFG